MYLNMYDPTKEIMWKAGDKIFFSSTRSIFCNWLPLRIKAWKRKKAMNGFLNILYEVIHYKTFWPKWDKSTDSHLNAIGISAANKVSVQMAIYFMVFRRVSSI